MKTYKRLRANEAKESLSGAQSVLRSFLILCCRLIRRRGLFGFSCRLGSHIAQNQFFFGLHKTIQYLFNERLISQSMQRCNVFQILNQRFLQTNGYRLRSSRLQNGLRFLSANNPNMQPISAKISVLPGFIS